MSVTTLPRMLELLLPKRAWGNEALAHHPPIVVSISGHESLSRLYQFQLELLSTNLDLRPEQFIGRPLTVAINRGPTLEPRYISGFVSRFSLHGVGPQVGQPEGYRQYRAEIVPWLWFLSQSADCRVFNHPPDGMITYMEIIESILRGAPIYRDSPLAKLNTEQVVGARDFGTEYCVQYRESDFNFVSRLMERIGVYYYFKHTRDGHELVLADVNSSPNQGIDTISLVDGDIDRQESHISRWEQHFDFVPGRWSHSDYDFHKPSHELLRESGRSMAEIEGNEDYHIFDYPGEFKSSKISTTQAEIRMEEIEVGHHLFQGASDCSQLSPAYAFGLATSNDQRQLIGHYRVTSIHHSASQPDPFASGGDGWLDYRNSFTCMPLGTPFRPPRVTKRPLIAGVQTAEVVGPAKQEIHCDKFGRVRVRFHWDRHGRDSSGEKLTCWIRCASQVAGKRWGFVGIPRVGQEVVVEFEEGNPDRPLIVGSVYNKEQMPHYTLPEHDTRTYIKTNSTPGGDGFNELMFDDKAGSERLYMHAEKDMDVVVRSCARSHIWGNRHKIIGGPEEGGDYTELRHGNSQLSIKEHVLEHIHGSYGLLVGHGDCADSPGVLDVVVEKKERKKIGPEGKHLTVDGACSTEIGGKLSISVSGVHHETCGGYALDTGEGDSHLKGANVVVEATTQLTLKVGSTFVTLSAAGVDISGPMVNINNGGAAGSGSGANPDPPETAAQAAPSEPDEAWNSTTGFPSNK